MASTAPTAAPAVPAEPAQDAPATMTMASLMQALKESLETAQVRLVSFKYIDVLLRTIGGIGLIHFYSLYAFLGAVLALVFPAACRLLLEQYTRVFTRRWLELDRNVQLAIVASGLAIGFLNIYQFPIFSLLLLPLQLLTVKLGVQLCLHNLDAALAHRE